MVLICLLLVISAIPQIFWGQHRPAAAHHGRTQGLQALGGPRFGLSQLMGKHRLEARPQPGIFLIVTPIAADRRLMGADSLQLKKWKKGTDSVFVKREGAIRDEGLVEPLLMQSLHGGKPVPLDNLRDLYGFCAGFMGLFKVRKNTGCCPSF